MEQVSFFHQLRYQRHGEAAVKSTNASTLNDIGEGFGNRQGRNSRVALLHGFDGIERLQGGLRCNLVLRFDWEK